MIDLDPRTLKFSRMSMWIDKVQKNLSDIENYFNSNDYSGIRRELQDQYKLIMILRDTMEGKTRLQGANANIKKET